MATAATTDAAEHARHDALLSAVCGETAHARAEGNLILGLEEEEEEEWTHVTPPPEDAGDVAHVRAGGGESLTGETLALAGGVALVAGAVAGALAVAGAGAVNRRRKAHAAKDARNTEEEPGLCSAAGQLHTRAATPPETPRQQRIAYECFVSYRRSDFSVADMLDAQLQLAGLRVFKDRSGHLSGQPFDEALTEALLRSAVFCPVITLQVVESLGRVDATSVDWCLVECVIALELHACHALTAIFPLLVGEPVPSNDGRLARDRLFANRAYKVARNVLPRIVPAATLAVADTLLCKMLGRGLRASLASATVRDIMLGRDDCQCSGGGDAEPSECQADSKRVHGILRMDACFLEGLQEDETLYLRCRYAANVTAALARAPPPAHLVLLREGLPLGPPMPWTG